MQKATLVERFVILLLKTMTLFTIRGLFTRFSAPTRAYFNEGYHLLVAIFLVILAITYNRFQTIFIIVLLFYLTNETISWSMFDILVGAYMHQYKGRRNSVRAALWTAYSCLVITWIYAIYYVRSGDIGHFVDGVWEPIKVFGDGIYFSVGVFLTYGFGDLLPHPDRYFTKAIVTLEPIVALVILVVYIAVFVSGFKTFWEPLIFNGAVLGQQDDTKIEPVKGKEVINNSEKKIGRDMKKTNRIYVLLLVSFILLSVYKIRKFWNDYRHGNPHA